MSTTSWNNQVFLRGYDIESIIISGTPITIRYYSLSLSWARPRLHIQDGRVCIERIGIPRDGDYLKEILGSYTSSYTSSIDIQLVLPSYNSATKTQTRLAYSAYGMTITYVYVPMHLPEPRLPLLLPPPAPPSAPAPVPAPTTTSHIVARQAPQIYLAERHSSCIVM